MTVEAVPGRDQVLMGVRKNFQLFLLGDGQLHVGVTKSTDLGFHVAQDAGAAVAIKAGNAGIAVSRVLPGIDFRQRAKSLGRVAKMTEFRLRCHVENLDVDKAEHDYKHH